MISAGRHTSRTPDPCFGLTRHEWETSKSIGYTPSRRSALVILLSRTNSLRLCQKATESVSRYIISVSTLIPSSQLSISLCVLHICSCDLGMVACTRSDKHRGLSYGVGLPSWSDVLRVWSRIKTRGLEMQEGFEVKEKDFHQGWTCVTQCQRHVSQGVELANTICLLTGKVLRHGR